MSFAYIGGGGRGIELLNSNAIMAAMSNAEALQAPRTGEDVEVEEDPLVDIGEISKNLGASASAIMRGRNPSIKNGFAVGT